MKTTNSFFSVVVSIPITLTNILVAQVKSPVEIPVGSAPIVYSKFSEDGKFLYFGQVSERSETKNQLTAMVAFEVASRKFKRFLLPKVKSPAQQLLEERAGKRLYNPQSVLRGFMPEKATALVSGFARHAEDRTKSVYVLAGWKPENWAPSWSVKSDDGSFGRMSFSNSDRFVGLYGIKNGNNNKRVRLIDVAAEKLTTLYSHKLPIEQVAVSADGKYVVSHGYKTEGLLKPSGSVETYLWNVNDKKIIRKIYEESGKGRSRPSVSNDLTFIGATHNFAFVRGLKLEVWAIDKDEPIRTMDNVLDLVGSRTTSRIAVRTRKAKKYEFLIQDAVTGKVIGKLPQKKLDELDAKYAVSAKTNRKTGRSAAGNTNVQILPFQLINGGKTLITVTTHYSPKNRLIKAFVLWDEDCWIK